MGTPERCERAHSRIRRHSRRQTHRELLVFWVPLPEIIDQPIDSVWGGVLLAGEAEVIFGTGDNLFDLGEVFVLG